MIAVALGLIGMVVMVATGVVVSSSGTDRLTFLGVAAETTTAQVFLTGAIFAWLFIVALWLLRVGMQRSGTRCVELAGRWVGLGSRVGLGDSPGASGASGDGGGAPRRVDGCPDLTDRVGAVAVEQTRPLMAGDRVSPVTGSPAVVGINVDRGGQGSEVGCGARLVSREYRRPDGDGRDGAGRQ